MGLQTWRLCADMHVYVQAWRQELYYIHSRRGKVGRERERIGRREI